MELTDKIFKFFGGIKPNGHKAISTINPIKRLPIPKKLIIPVRQHVGKVPNIKVSEERLEGSILSLLIHSSLPSVSIVIQRSGSPDGCGILLDSIAITVPDEEE